MMFGLVDCETTGLLAHENGLIEFTMAVIDPATMVEVDRYHSGQIRVAPGSCIVTEEALKVNGYSPDTLHLGREPLEVAADFASFIERYNGPLTFVSFNAMDWGFIELLFGRHGFNIRDFFSHRRIDIQTIIVARNALTGVPDGSSSLKVVAKEFGSPTLPDHSSDSDVSAAAHIFQRLAMMIDWALLFPPKRNEPENSEQLVGNPAVSQEDPALESTEPETAPKVEEETEQAPELPEAPPAPPTTKRKRSR